MGKAPTIVLGFSGSATLRKADDIADRLKEALSAGDHIEIDCDGLEEVDVSFIQILIATRKSALASGKELTLTAPAQGCLLAALTAAGIGPAGSQGFWFGERTP